MKKILKIFSKRVNSYTVLLKVRHSFKIFIYIKSLTPCKNPMRQGLLAPTFRDEATQPQAVT